MLGILVPTLLLFVIGSFNIFGIRSPLLVNHLIFFGMAIVAFVAMRKIGFRLIEQHSKLFYVIFVVLLAVTFLVGLEARGSRRWIDIGFFNFQPSEFFKVFFTMAVAAYFSAYDRVTSEDLTVYMRALAILFVPALIILRQPDLGTTLVYIVVFFSIALVSRVSRRALSYTFILGAAAAPVLWIFLKDYQRNRLISFIDPSVDSLGSGYNVLQAVITTGSGQFLGKGLGFGTQTKLFFLPENHTDFAFSSLVEQFGFVGGATVLCIYGVLVYVVMKRIFALQQKTDPLSRTKFFYCVGFVASFVFQIVVNVGMNMGIMPVTGVTLPFVSYGGSSLMSLMMALALL
jgi:rod shape determining protein RodA